MVHLDGEHHGAGGGRDAGHALHEIKRDAFRQQHAARAALHLRQEAAPRSGELMSRSIAWIYT